MLLPPSAPLAQHQTSTGSTPRVGSSWSGSAYCWRHRPNVVKCWASVAGAGQYPFSPSEYFMLVGARAHSAWSAAAESEIEVSAYFTSVHITVFWKGCDRHWRRQRNGSICLFHKCAYTVFLYLIHKWAHTAFWQHCYTQDGRTEMTDRQTDR